MDEIKETGEACFYCDKFSHGADNCPMSDEGKNRVIYGAKPCGDCGSKYHSANEHDAAKSYG